jgi:enoyl-CoA hydratase/carnithine racemase
MVEEIGHALDEAESRPALCAVVLTGTGRAFCAGADLKEAKSLASSCGSAASTEAFIAEINALAGRIERFRLPVIAAVNGLAIAGGLELVLACDLVIAAQSARMGDGHAKYGLLPGAGGSVRLPRKVGANRAKYLMFTAEYLPAEVLESWGLVNAVVPDSELEAAASSLAGKLGDKSPVGLSRMKQLVNDSADQTADAALRSEQLMSALHLHARDRAEGLAAFAEKRAPHFTGQ